MHRGGKRSEEYKRLQRLLEKAIRRAEEAEKVDEAIGNVMTVADLQVFFKGRDASEMFSSAEPTEEELTEFLGSGMSTSELQDMIKEQFGEAPQPGAGANAAADAGDDAGADGAAAGDDLLTAGDDDLGFGDDDEVL